MNKVAPRIAVVGSGPAGLMAADVVSAAGFSVSIFERRRGPGRKLLVAGSTGLNVSNNLPPPLFFRQYRGATPEFWAKLFQEFSVNDWLGFLEKELGIKTFMGSSGHYFVEGMRASRVLRAWLTRLGKRGVEIHYDRELSGIETTSGGVTLEFDDKKDSFAAVCLAMGGGSWEDTPPRWPGILKAKGVEVAPFQSSNAGFHVAWPPPFLAEAEGQPLKNVVMTSERGRRQGDVTITKYGVEGMPVYHVGTTGVVHLDLEPNQSAEKILERCRAVKENLSPLRRLKKKAGLSPAASALLFHCAPEATRGELAGLVALVKNFPLVLGDPRPLEEAISSSGGLKFSELGENLSLKKLPRVFAAGEMLDWDVSTGGFLIQASVSQGRLAGKSILAALEYKSG